MSRTNLSASPTKEVVAMVNRLGLQAAARELNSSPATLSRWLRQQNYQLRRVYVLTNQAKLVLESE